MASPYLEGYFETFYWAPGFCLWRAFELHALSEMEYHHPILDLGCGDGFFAKSLFSGPLEAGLDIVEAEVRRARSAGIYRNLVVSDASEGVPFADSLFGTVVSNCVIEHIPDVDTVLHEVRRVLKPGGHFVFTVPSEFYERFLLVPRWLRRVGLERLAQYRTVKRNQTQLHHNVWPVDVWRAHLNQAGFSVVEASYIMPQSVMELWDILYLLFQTGPRVGPRRFTLGGLIHVLPIQALRGFTRECLREAFFEELSVYCDRHAGPVSRGGVAVLRAARHQ